MCINQEISLNTFLFGLFAISIAYGNGIVSIPIALYYISFISMQLIEFFTWRNLSNQNSVYYLSILAFAFIIVQPFIYIYAGISKKPERTLLLSLYTLYVFVILFILVPYYKIQFSMSRAENGHLAWHWLDFPLWVLLIWFSFLVYVMIQNEEYIKIIAWTFVIGYIYVIYSKSKTWGTLWCWIANIFGLVLLYKVFKKSVDIGCNPLHLK